MSVLLKKNRIYSSFYEKLKCHWPEQADEVWAAADKMYAAFCAENNKEPLYMRYYLYPVVALYLQMKEININEEDAVELLIEQGSEFGEKLRRHIFRVTSCPGVSKLIWKNMAGIVESTSSPKMGYTRENMGFDGTLAKVDITGCPLCDEAERLGAKRACLAICAADKIYLTGIRNIDYKRTKAVANGDDVCDYRFTKKIAKESGGEKK